MKKKVFAYTISIIILITLAMSVFLVMRPVLAQVSEGFERIQNHYLTILRDNTGLDVSYRSLSPSILAGIRMSGIEVTDIKSKEVLISIDSVRLKWNIFKLFGENPADALGELVISGVNADYDHLQQYEVRDKLFTFIQSIQDSSTSQEPKETMLSVDIGGTEQIPTDAQSLLKVLFSFPINVRLKNTSLAYADSNVQASLFFSDITMQNQDKTGHLNLSIDGKALLSPLQKDLASLGMFVAGFSLQSSLTPQLEDSFAQMHISSLRESDYTIPRLDVHSTYSDDTVQAYVMQNRLPFTLSFFADMLSENLEVDFRAAELNPFDLISIKAENNLMDKLEGSTISGAYKLAYSWNTDTLAYNVDGSANISPKLIGDNLKTTFRFEGNPDILLVDYLDVESEIISANYEGSIDLQNFLPQGVIDVRSVKLPSDNPLSATIYIDSYDNEVVLFSPQVYFGDRSLTALQLNGRLKGSSIDFTFEVSDYSRAGDSPPGVLEANGSFLFDEQQFLQLQISTETLFLDSIMEIALWCLPEENSALLSPFVPALSPYIFSFDLFFSTDFETLSYNMPYALIANTQKDDELLLFSFDGNESLFQLSNLDMLVGGQSIQAEANADLGDGENEIFFGLSLFINSLPYTFSGVFMPNQYLNVNGDYGFNLVANFLENETFAGTFQVLSLPILIEELLFSLSLETDFMYNSPQDWFVQADRFEVSEISGTMAVQPRMVLGGRMDRDGIFFNNAVYSDELSTLEGSIAISWNLNDNVIENLTFDAELEDSFSSEKYVVTFDAFNPNRFIFTDPQFFNNVYFSSDILIHALPSGRFANFQNEDNTINASFTGQGTIENPSLSLTIEDSSFFTGASNTIFNGTVVLEDKVLEATNINLQYKELSFNDVGGQLVLNDFSGIFTGFLDGRLDNSMYFKNKTFSSPIELSITPLGNNADLPLIEKSFQIDLVFKELRSSFFDTMENYRIELIRTPGRFDLNVGINRELSGYLLDSGELEVSAKEGFFVLFDAYGIINKDTIAVVIDNIVADGRSFSRLLDLPVFSLHSGMVVGSGTITGDLRDPQFDAELFGTNMEVSVPDYVDERLVCDDFRITTSQNVFSAVDSYFVGQKSGAEVNFTIELSLEQMELAYLNLDIKTLNDTMAVGKYVMPHGSFTGQAGVALTVQIFDDLVEVRGNINAADIEAVITLAPTEIPPVSDGDDVIVDLVISVDSRAELFIPSKNNPLIRGLVNQQEPLIIQIDERYGTSLFSGDFTMHGGEIRYLNRTFYVRDALAVLNETLENFDPRLTATAEIRERDQNGDPIRIILSVIDQPLSQLISQQNLIFTSIPSKTEQEIMTLLGQIIATGDPTDSNPLALLGGLADYGVQLAVTSVLGNIETKVRDFLNVDIFSVRTMFLQNLLVGATGNIQPTVGNFLDNTTVYIGKFLDDTLYADAMLHLTYDESRDKEGNLVGGLVFQPEIGLELPSPFATIRWSIAPELTTDLTTYRDLFVPSASISFSWKFNL